MAFDCKEVQKKLSVMEKALDKLDGRLAEMEKALGLKRSSRIAKAIRKARDLIGKATKLLGKGTLPVDICVSLGESFDMIEKAAEAETRRYQDHCRKLDWDGDARLKERCLKVMKYKKLFEASEAFDRKKMKILIKLIEDTLDVDIPFAAREARKSLAKVA